MEPQLYVNLARRIKYYNSACIVVERTYIVRRLCAHLSSKGTPVDTELCQSTTVTHEGAALQIQRRH